MRESQPSRHLSILLKLLVVLAVSMHTTSADAVSHYQYPRSCNDCHNTPPLDSPFRNISIGSFKGNHQTHAASFQTTCTRCHPGSDTYSYDHRNNIIPFSGNINNSPAGSQYWIDGAAVSFYNHTSLPVMGSCSNVNCHFETATPTWGSGYYSSPSDCNRCHGVPPAGTAPDYTGGAAGKHTIHESHFPGVNNCNKCHPDHLTGSPFTHATSAGHIGSSVTVTLNPGTYSGSGTGYLPSQASGKTYGTCSNTYCHGSGTPDWSGGPLPSDCTGCHGNDATSAAPINSGRHSSHMNNYTTLGRDNNLPCIECHAGTVSDNRTKRTNGLHLNGIKNYSGARSGSNVTPGSGKCTNVYCHSTGMQINQFRDMAGSDWYSGRSFSCNGCHGAPALPDGTFAAFTSVSGEPNYANGGVGTATANSHRRHVNELGITDSTGCSRCHRTTTDLAIAGKFRDFTTSHLNEVRNVVFPEALQGRYSSTTQQCVSLYCHSNGSPFDNTTVIYNNQRWGDTPLTCASCHADPSDADRLSGRHGKHTASGIFVSTCDRCHMNTIDSSGKIIGKSLHANRSKDVIFRDSGSYNTTTKGCSVYCHSDALTGKPVIPVKWTDTKNMECYTCHKGRTSDNGSDACLKISGSWNSEKGLCTPYINMTSNGHGLLVGPQWIRKYPCYFCHNNTVDAAGNIKNASNHVNNIKDIAMAPQWNIVGRDDASYDPATMVCANVYCHSDGTTNPEQVRPFAWTEPKTECNTCHGHPNGTCNSAGCHDGRTDINGKVWTNIPGGSWPSGQEWKASLPMFKNDGPGTARANSHPRHIQTDFTCDLCHATTVKAGSCTTCHVNGIPPGGMGEVAHIDAAFHVNRNKDVAFNNTSGSYDPISKKCSNTTCHRGYEPVWGGSVNDVVTCFACHGDANSDVDDFTPKNNIKGKINLNEWYTIGHGRYSTSGRYPTSSNPAANFGSNPCWYCHDNNVLHNYTTNPYRLRKHPQFIKRFEKECVYCHMQRDDLECMSCHNSAESLAPQLANMTAARYSQNHGSYAGGGTSCIASCHASDPTIHKTGSRFWTLTEKEDVKNQYIMMGVCLQCHDDDSNDQCTSCHTAPESNPTKYSIGFNPNLAGTRFIKPKKARASSAHFGYKHFRAYETNGTWKGGKFCWDCHDPHGDKNIEDTNNIYMIQREVATTTDGLYGKPLAKSPVVFTKKVSGKDYARSSAPFNGICNVCHSFGVNKHYLKDGGDKHNESRVCTICHEHRFADSHANKQKCDACHQNKKPVPKHAAFSLPRDCTKCHAGIIGNRMDIMTQLKSNSHHVQVADPKDISNKHCYACHWESTAEGLIDNQYHEGYNYKTYTSVKNEKVDLVVWKPAQRPTWYNTTTAVTFLAKNIGTINERNESEKVTDHCLGCHSDQNNDTRPFEKDCNTPRQYAWDYQSIAARYSQQDVITWGKYPGTAGAAKKNIAKAFSAHGNAKNNAGGWDTTNGTDGVIANRRAGSANVQCFDCHSSHGSSLVGTTSSYLTFNNTKNGGNLKETQAGKGGYGMTYKASANTAPGAVNPYNAGAGQCFDCHFTRNAGTTPWGYYGTFGAMSSIKGYMDSDRFGASGNAITSRTFMKGNKASMKGGHFKASSALTTSPSGTIDGLCSPCHDPHGVSPILGDKQAYAVPLLKGTWMTSPYKEDNPPPNPYGTNATATTWGTPEYYGRKYPGVAPVSNYNTDRTTFGAGKITEADEQFAGLCLNCHAKASLTDGTNKNKSWKSIDRIHETVKGWGANTEHSFSCSKCHAPHTSGLPRLMVTNCLDYKHRGYRTSGGQVYSAYYWPTGGHGRTQFRGFPAANVFGNSANADPTIACHASGVGNGAPGYPNASWPDKQLWNQVTPW